MEIKNNIEVCKSNTVDLAKIEKISNDLPSVDDIIGMAETFKVLADPTRLKIVLALTFGELCVCDLATLIGVSVSAISHQLRLLKGMRIVKYRKDGKMVYYSLDDSHIENLVKEAVNHAKE